MRRIGVDRRWAGTHGIGRYSAEVISRLTVDWGPLDVVGNPADPREALRVPHLVGDGAPDIIYSPGYNAFIRTKAKQVVTVHDLIHLRASWPGRVKYVAYYDGFLRSVIKRSNTVLTVSDTSARAIRRWLRDDEVTIVNTGNGCSRAFAPRGPKHVEDIPYVLYVGNLRAHKNVMPALAGLARTNGLRAILVTGDRERARQLVGRLGIASKVRVDSSLDDSDLATYYRGAAATLMPSRLEGFGLPALESLACGTPVIYWQGCDSVREIVGSNGWAVESSADPRQWACALNAASTLSVSLDFRARSWDDVAGRVSAVLERCLRD